MTYRGKSKNNGFLVIPLRQTQKILLFFYRRHRDLVRRWWTLSSTKAAKWHGSTAWNIACKGSCGQLSWADIWNFEQNSGRFEGQKLQDQIQQPDDNRTADHHLFCRKNAIANMMRRWDDAGCIQIVATYWVDRRREPEISIPGRINWCCYDLLQCAMCLLSLCLEWWGCGAVTITWLFCVFSLCFWLSICFFLLSPPWLSSLEF